MYPHYYRCDLALKFLDSIFVNMKKQEWEAQSAPKYHSCMLHVSTVGIEITSHFVSLINSFPSTGEHHMANPHTATQPPRNSI